jgi:hypothetical protein
MRRAESLFDKEVFVGNETLRPWGDASGVVDAPIFGVCVPHDEGYLRP